MKIKPIAIVLILCSSVLTSLAQIMYKLTAERLIFTNILSYITNYPFIFGLFLYGAAGILLIKAFKYGEVTFLYPIFASSYILVILISRYLFNEPITSYKIIGVLMIILGIALISIGSKKTHPTLEYEGGAI